MKDGYQVWCDICKRESKSIPASAFKYGDTDVCYDCRERFIREGIARHYNKETVNG